MSVPISETRYSAIKDQSFENKPRNWRNIFLLIFIGIGLLSGVFYAGIRFATLKNNDQQITELKNPSPTSSQVSIALSQNIPPQTSTINTGCNLYTQYNKEPNNQTVFINIESQQIKNLIPSGYGLNYAFDLTPSPDYFILTKDNSLFSYNIKNQLLNEILATNNLKLKKTESSEIHPSITAKDNFFIIINENKQDNEPYGMGLPPEPISQRSYLFDASTNKLQSVVNPNFTWLRECFMFDSKNQRFFVYPCGEGIGTSIPLSVSDLKGNSRREIVSLSDFGLTKNDRMTAVEYNDGNFFMLSKKTLTKIIVVNTQLPEPAKETYTVSESVKNKLKDNYPYSTAIDIVNNNLIIGGDDYVLLLRFNNDKNIVDSVYLPDDRAYINFLFVSNGKAYYNNLTSKLIRVVNLGKWKIEKTIKTDAAAGVTFLCINE
jgi:hypothetical protein